MSHFVSMYLIWCDLNNDENFVLQIRSKFKYFLQVEYII
jgi:hypothetical protein